ncbi:HEPN domain-containing protein [Stenotrophomonas rhizophila]
MDVPRAPPKLPRHLQRFFDNLGDVRLLMEAHGQIAGAGRGRKRDVEVLNKSAIVFLVACWEVYVEDVIESALTLLMTTAPDHTVFPDGLLTRIGNKSQGANAWRLAGDGWRVVLKENLNEVLATTIGGLNTPKSGNLDDLYRKAIGMEKLSQSWFWRGRNNAKAVADLDALISLRGDIAHRVKLETPVRKSHVTDGSTLVLRLAVLTHNGVGQYMQKRLGKRAPGWGVAQYKAKA